MIKKLAEIAHQLDMAGEYRLADKVDALVADMHKQAAPKPQESAKPNAMSRSPEWCEAASKSLPLLDQAMDAFTDHHVQVTTSLPLYVEELRRILDYNKRTQAVANPAAKASTQPTEKK